MINEIQKEADEIQNECHTAASGIIASAMRSGNKEMTYQDAANSYIFYKLGELVYRIKELEAKEEMKLQ